MFILFYSIFVFSTEQNAKKLSMEKIKIIISENIIKIGSKTTKIQKVILS